VSRRHSDAGSYAEPGGPGRASDGARARRSWTGRQWSGHRRLLFCGFAALLTALFLSPLGRLFTHVRASELHSHVPLVPLVAAYLLHARRASLPRAFKTSVPATVAAAVVGFGILAGSVRFGTILSLNDNLGLLTAAYICFLAAGGFFFLGSRWMATAAFPVAFLAFMIPLPDEAVAALERALAAASAEAAAVAFTIAGYPMFREGTVFQLPGIVLEVGPECSGIHSTWALLITSIVASHLVLSTAWRRALLVAFVIPLGIVRNGFRILVIGALCVDIGPHMADSLIHRRGGPLFFALSLVPLFALLGWLRRREVRGMLLRQ